MIVEKAFFFPSLRWEVTFGFNSECHDDWLLTPALTADVNPDIGVYALGIAWLTGVAYVDIDFDA